MLLLHIDWKAGLQLNANKGWVDNKQFTIFLHLLQINLTNFSALMNVGIFLPFLLMQLNLAYLGIFVYMCFFGITNQPNAFSTTVANSNFNV